MATQIIVPTLGEAIAEATLVSWSIHEGDPVRRGEEVAELETDKANLGLECPANGVLLSILAHPGEVVRPGQVLALVGKPGEGLGESPGEGLGKRAGKEAATSGEQGEGSFSATNTSESAGSSTAQVQEKGAEVEAQSPERGERVSPAARRVARQLGIDLAQVSAAKPGARITTEDVERYAAGSGRRAAGLPFRRIPLSRVQKAVAERMAESARIIPQFSVSIDADVSRLMKVKEELAFQGLRASVTALLIQLTTRALGQHPLLNARFDGDAILAYETVNLAVAAATPEGLVAPVLREAQKLSLPEIVRGLDELLPAARENRLSLDQVSEATFTISNLGMHGVHGFVPLVNPPQSAILGVGAARPAVLPTRNWGIQTVWLMTLTVSADHRVLDGEAAALFLASLKEEVEKAEFIH